MKCGALRFFYEGVLSVFSDFQAIRWRIFYPLNNHHQIDWSLYALTKTIVKYIHYIIIKKSTFTKLSYLTTNWIIFWTNKVYFLRLWVAMVMSYMSGIVIFMVKWCGTQPWLRVYGSNPPGDLTKNRQKLLLLTLNTLTCSNYVSF